jgi:hypothetical protein
VGKFVDIPPTVWDHEDINNDYKPSFL